MTLHAGLVVSGDSSGGVQALAELDSAVGASEARVEGIARRAAQAETSIADMAAASQTAAKEAEHFAKATGAADAGAAGLAAASDAAAGSIERGAAAVAAAGGKVGQSLKLTAQDGLNFSRQFADIGVTAAMGMNPLMIALQQGPQLFDALQMAAARTGASIGAVVKALGVQIWTALAPVLPVLLAIAAAAGVVYGSFKLWTSSGANAEVKAYTNTLGLTKKEMKELGDTSVTLGDAMAGLWKTFDDATGLSDVFASIKEWAVDAFETALTWGKEAAASIYAGFVGAYRAIKEVWSDLPKVLGEAAINAANAAITAMENLINKAIDALNALRKRVDPIMIAADMAGIDLGVGHVKLGQIENQYAGAGKKAAAAFAKAYAEEYAKAIAWMDKVGATIADNIIGAAKDRLAKRAKELIDDRPEKKAKKLSDAMKQELLVTEMQIGALGRIAKAYGESSAAGLRMEIVTKAETEALKKKASAAETALYIDQQLRLAVAESLADAEKEATLLREQTAAQKGFNDQVAAGLITAEKAVELLQIEAALRPYVLALTLAEGKAHDDLAKAIERARTEMGLANAEAKRAQDIQRAGDARAQIKMLTSEIDLTRKLGAARLDAMSGLRGLALDDELARINAEHEKELILLRAKVDAEKARKEGLFKTADAIMDLAKKQIAAIDVGLETEKLESAFQTLKSIADSLDFGSIFGRGGAAIDSMTAALERLNDAQTAHRTLLVAAGGDAAKIAAADKQYQIARQAGTVAMIGSAKSLFKEHTTGYKAMAAAEKAFAVVQIANTAINVAAGAAKMFATLGPFGFPAVAAMVAVMAGLGAAVSGGKSSYRAPTAEDVQQAQGTGSVLGAADAKSASIANSLDRLVSNANRDLEYSNEMARSLRAIESNIGALTNVLARQLNVPGGGFDTAGLGLGSKTSMGLMGTAALGVGFGAVGLVLSQVPVIGDILGGIVKTLFGTKKTVTLLDQGISFAADSVENIINSGIVGQIYQDVQTQTKKKFLGLTTSNKTSVSTQYGDLGGEMERQVALIIGSLRSGVIDAAGILGVEGAEAALDAFQVNLGKISLKDLKGSEIQDALSAVFSKLGDDMAAAALPGLEAFQKVGEGMFETIVRLADDYRTIDTALASIGMTFGAVGLASVRAREDLIDLFGSLDGFAEATASFRDKFLTEAEQMAPIVAAVGTEMARLGHAGVATIEQFKALVLGLDLSSAAGADMYASLMAVAPAFARIIEYQDGLAQKAADLQRQYMQLSGDEAGALAMQRRQEIDALDESLRPMLERIHALQDEQAAAAEAARVAEEAARIEADRAAMEIEYYRALGRESVATVLQRAIEIRAMDESLRPMQARIWALQDQAKIEAEAAARAKAIADERFGLENRLLQLQGDTAALRGRELDALDPANRALLERIFALEDEAAATEAAAAAAKAIADERFGLESRLLQVQGDTAALRQRELDALDPANRALLMRIFALEDEAVAAEAAAATAKAIADERFGLEARLLQVQGDAAALRQRELDALDPANRALLIRIFALEDEAAATEAAAAAAKAVADERFGLEARLLQVEGDTAALRQRELDALDPSNRALLIRIFALEDEAVAAEAAAAAAKAVADERFGLEARLLQVQGDTAALRQRELDALDPANRALLERIFALEDETAAIEAAAAAAKAIADERFGLEARLLQVQGDTAALRQRELDALDPANRALLDRIFALEDETAAIEAAATAAKAIADERVGLETRLLQVQGDAAALRQRELDALDPSNRALLERIFALEDETAATEAAAAAAKAVADERFGLETRLLQVQGDAAALRQRELDALDPSNRALLERIFALEDESAAAKASAAAAKAIADERFGLETRLLQVQGDAAALRQRELDALDPANRALLMRIFALEDETAAAEAATAAAKAIADERYGLEARLLQVQGDAAALRQREIDALDPSNRALLMRIFALEDETAAAEAAAAAAKAIADERFGLETRLLQLQGNTAALRQRELDALDPSNRALLMRIFAIEDATAAAETQTASLRSLAGEHQRTVDIFGRLALDLRAYREKLLAGDGGTPEGYAAARDRFGSVAALARAGDAAALGELRSVGDAFLAASMANSRSAIDYQRDLAGVIGAVDEAAFAAEAVADYAEVQRQAAERQIGLLERIAANTAHMAGPGSGPGTGAAPVPGVPAVPASAPLPAEAPAELLAELRALRQESRSHSVRANELLAKLEVYHKRWDGGDHMKTSGFDPDTPAYVEVLP